MSAYRRTYKHALSVSEAIERIFDYEKQHYSLSDILQFTVEQSERNYREALTDPDREAEIPNLKKELESDKHERDLAREMSIELNTAADNLMAGGTHKYLVLSQRDHHRLQPHFPKASLYAWAKECHGKVIPEWASTPATAIIESSPSEANFKTWEGVTIRFRAHNKLVLSVPDGKSRTIDLESTRLFDKRFKRPNMAGTALLGLATASSISMKGGASGTGVSSKVMSELRTALKEIARIDSDPFYSYNTADKWKPRFQVQDRRNAADERAKEKAERTSISYREGQPLEASIMDDDTNDPAAQFLRKHDQ